MTSVNDAPIVNAPGSALAATEQVGLAIHGTGFSVTDVDEAGAGARAVLSVGEGTIMVAAGNSGVTIDAGNGSGAVTILGTIAEINNLLTGGGHRHDHVSQQQRHASRIDDHHSTCQRCR